MCVLSFPPRPAAGIVIRSRLAVGAHLTDPRARPTQGWFCVDTCVVNRLGLGSVWRGDCVLKWHLPPNLKSRGCFYVLFSAGLGAHAH